MLNVACVKWGNKYEPVYANKLFSMVKRNVSLPFNFFCYTEDSTGLDKDITIIPIQSNLTHWWLKLDLLKHFTKGDTILFDLDVVILNNLNRLLSTKTRTLTVLYSQWKEGFLNPVGMERNPTLYNSSLMKWQDEQGLAVYNYFKKFEDKILLKYQGIDRFLFNEPVDVDLFPTSIAYSYWKGVRYKKDTTPEKLRNDYEVCIINHSPKTHELDGWVKEYWQ